jgi:NAD(P)-dependent dehydrogenase (short-subunit alcohol dehydrogenase family)
VDTEMQERLRRASTSDLPRSDEYRAIQREGRLRSPKDAARVIAYLALPATMRNGETLHWDDADLAHAVEAAFPG